MQVICNGFLVMDFLEAVSGIHNLYQISSLFPHKIDRKTWTLRRSRCLEIYSITIIAASMAFLLFDLFSKHDFIRTTDNDLEQKLEFFQILSMRISYIASVSESLVKRKEHKRFYQEVKEIDSIFERSLNMDVKNGKFRQTTIKLGLLITFVYLFSEFYILTSKILFQEKIFIIFWFLYLIPLLICGIKYFQIFSSVRLLKHRFDLLEKVLNQLNPEQQKSKTKDVKLIENAKVSGEQKYSVALLELSMFKTRHCDMENPDLKKLLIVRELYNRLFYLNEIFNCCFGVSMLINVGNNFFSITSNCYWVFYNFHDFHATKNIFSLIGNSSVWSLPHLMNVVLLAILCERTIQKTNKIALKLYSVNVDIWNDNLSTVIEQFSLQLLHQKLSITAAGFFNVDCTLLYAIVGAITTYLIILIQFHVN